MFNKIIQINICFSTFGFVFRISYETPEENDQSDVGEYRHLKSGSFDASVEQSGRVPIVKLRHIEDDAVPALVLPAPVVQRKSYSEA